MDDKQETCKVVIVGESGVGKTSIIRQFLNQTFVVNSPFTVGANYSSAIVNINGQKKKFTIWDTAGQEKYRSLIKMFYKDASAAILVYDITDTGSFIEIQKYWYKELSDNCPNNIIFAIAANKSDLYEQEAVDEIEARKYAKEAGAIFAKTSALDASGIDNLFIEIGVRFIRSDENKHDERSGTVSVTHNNPDDYIDKNGKEKKRCC